MKIHPYPPGPQTWPSLRLLWQLQRDPLTFLSDVAATYGDLSYFQIGPRHVYLVNQPELIKEVLVTQQAAFAKGQALQRVKPLLGNGLLTSEGVYHLQQRRHLQPLFHRRQIATYAERMVQQAAQVGRGSAVARWQSGTALDIHEAMMGLTLRIVGETLFGQDLTANQATIGQALTVLTRNFQRLLTPWGRVTSRLPTRENRRLQASVTTLEQMVDDLMIDGSQAETQGTLVTMLLAAFAEETLTPDELYTRLRDEMLTLLLAGHETTANALTFSWWLLAQHAEVADRFYGEIDAVCGGRLPTLADVEKLSYTRMVFSEALRLYPPAWAIGRQALTAVDLGGYPVPAGATVLLSQWVMHHNPCYYPNPRQFNPMRWLPEVAAQRPKYAFFPFGGGSRLCIGEQFAWLEGILLLATIGQQWRFVAEPAAQLAVQPGITLRPKEPVMLVAVKR